MWKSVGRKKLVEVAELAADQIDNKVRQMDIAAETGLQQTRISILGNLKKKACPEVFEAWEEERISTVVATHLSKLSDTRQQELLEEKPAGKSPKWNRKVAKEAKEEVRPYVREVRALLAELIADRTMNRQVVEVAVAALRYTLGIIEKESLYQALHAEEQ
jgi:hypothetical protein